MSHSWTKAYATVRPRDPALFTSPKKILLLPGLVCLGILKLAVCVGGGGVLLVCAHALLTSRLIVCVCVCVCVCILHIKIQCLNANTEPYTTRWAITDHFVSSV